MIDKLDIKRIHTIVNDYTYTGDEPMSEEDCIDILGTLDYLYENYNEMLNKLTQVNKALDMACNELAKSDTTRFVLLGGSANDYKARFIKESEKK